MFLVSLLLIIIVIIMFINNNKMEYFYEFDIPESVTIGELFKLSDYFQFNEFNEKINTPNPKNNYCK